VLAPHYKYRSLVVPQLATERTAERPASANGHSTPHSRITWARLLKRVFNIDIETCQACGGSVRIISAIEDPAVIRKILTHLGLNTKPPPIHPARGPPGLPLDEYSQMPSYDLD
jgi:hypothetical protein